MKMSRLAAVAAAFALTAPFALAGQANHAATPSAAAPAAAAVPPAKAAKIKELLHVLKVDQVGEQLVQGANQQTETLGRREFGENETPEQQKQVAALHDKVIALVTPAVSWSALEPEFVSAYSTAYTEPEIDSILTFYKSPAGQALLNKGPEIAQQSSRIVQERMATIQPQLRQAVQEFAKAAQPAPATPPSRPAPSLSSPSTTTPPPSSTK